MANRQLSQIASGGALVAATDALVAVRSGTTDVLITPGTAAQNATGDFASSATTVNGHALSSNVTVSASDITTGTLPTAQLSTNQTIMSVGVSLDGGGSTLSTGQKGYVTCPFAGTIVAWDITADTGTCTFDIWKIATGTAVPTVTNTITASAKPALATGTAIHSTTLTGWSTGVNVAANDIFGFNLDAVATATKLTLVLQINKT